METEEVILDGLSVESAAPSLVPEDEMFPHVVNVDVSDGDSRAAETVDSIALLAELALCQKLSGPMAQQSMATLISDPFFQQFLGLAERAAA